MATKKTKAPVQRQLDEQVVYIDPEENITEVRERLGRIEGQHIALVVPPQTHPRSGSMEIAARSRQRIGQRCLYR